MKRYSKSMMNNELELIILEDFEFTSIDNNGKEVIKKIKRSIPSKIIVNIDDIRIKKELINSKGKHYKNKFIAQIHQVGDVILKGNIIDFQNKINKIKEDNLKRVIVKGFDYNFKK